MKPIDLSSDQLELAVASCLGHVIQHSEGYGLEVLDAQTGHLVQGTDYTSSWSDAGPVIERMRSMGVLLVGGKVTFSAVIDGDPRIAEASGPILRACMQSFVEVVTGNQIPVDLAELLVKHCDPQAI